MKSITVSEFREQCLQLFDDIPADGVLITKRGKPVAKVVRVPKSCSHLIGTIKNLIVNEDDDLFSTGIVWDAELGHPHST
jgi:antitoxin (DNA-binding transcriptional repressor) of toxin-antitoxin stability system